MQLALERGTRMERRVLPFRAVDLQARVTSTFTESESPPICDPHAQDTEFIWGG